MGLEGGVVDLGDLNPLWPLATDERSTADDHLRNIKTAVTSLLTFPEGLEQLGFPASVAAGAGKALVVNSGLTAYELGGPFAAAALFPSPTANAGKILKVNAGGTAFDLLTQGTGGTLDADTLDGSHAAAFGIPNVNQAAAQTGGSMAVTVGNGTYMDVTGATITISTSGTYLVLGQGQAFADQAAYGLHMSLVNNGVELDQAYENVSGSGAMSCTLIVWGIAALTAAQVIKLRASMTMATGTASIALSKIAIIRLA